MLKVFAFAQGRMLVLLLVLGTNLRALMEVRGKKAIPV